jgi:cytochrome c556
MRAFLCAMLLAALACAPPARVRYEERLEAATPAEAHAVHAARLVEVMRGLDRLVEERLPRGMDETWERERRVEELSTVASAISASARQIHARAGERDRSHAEQRAFAGRALVLEQRADALAENTATLTPEEIVTRVEALREACAACHRRFRDPPSGSAR